MKKEITSNYEIACLKWQQVFVNMDKERLMELLPEIKIEGDYLTIYHFGRKFGVHIETGEIIAMEDDLPISISEKFNIYLLFHYVKPGASKIKLLSVNKSMETVSLQRVTGRETENAKISRETLSIFIHLLNQHFFHHLEFVNLNGMLNTQGQVLIL